MIDKEHDAPLVADRNSATGEEQKTKITTNITKFNRQHLHPAKHLMARFWLKMLCLKLVEDCYSQLKPVKEIIQDFVIGILQIREEMI